MVEIIVPAVVVMFKFGFTVWAIVAVTGCITTTIQRWFLRQN